MPVARGSRELCSRSRCWWQGRVAGPAWATRACMAARYESICGSIPIAGIPSRSRSASRQRPSRAHAAMAALMLVRSGAGAAMTPVPPPPSALAPTASQEQRPWSKVCACFGSRTVMRRRSSTDTFDIQAWQSAQRRKLMRSESSESSAPLFPLPTPPWAPSRCSSSASASFSGWRSRAARRCDALALVRAKPYGSACRSGLYAVRRRSLRVLKRWATWHSLRPHRGMESGPDPRLIA